MKTFIEINHASGAIHVQGPHGSSVLPGGGFNAEKIEVSLKAGAVECRMTPLGGSEAEVKGAPSEVEVRGVTKAEASKPVAGQIADFFSRQESV